MEIASRKGIQHDQNFDHSGEENCQKKEGCIQIFCRSRPVLILSVRFCLPTKLKYRRKMRVQILIILFSVFPTFLSTNVGILSLDGTTFNKTLRAFPFSFVKFDTKSPSGPKHEVFKTLAKDLIDVDKLLVAEVRIPGYGSPLNHDLGQRFQLNQGVLPELIFFQRKKLSEKKYDFDSVRYGGEFDEQHFRRFLKHKTGLWLGFPGCIKELDEIAEFFARNSGKDQLQAIKQVEDLVDEFEQDKAKVGQKYLKIMKLAQVKGIHFITEEIKRIKKLLAEKVSRDKIEDLNLTLNILKSFHVQPQRDEL